MKQYTRFWMASLAASLLLSLANAAHANAQSSVVQKRHDFDSRSLLVTRDGPAAASGFSLVNPERFSMRQSYSLSAVTSSAGSMSSGVYLNTLRYQLSEPLTMTLDVGMHTPIHSSLPGSGPGSHAAASGSSLILPRMGLEYRPNDRMSVHLDLINGQDAWKAYGTSPWSPYSMHGSRFSP